MSAAATVAEPSVTALADALRPALLRVSRRLRQEAQRAGLSAQDALLLVAIKKNPGIGVSGLAEMEQTAKPTMSAHVKRLESLGLVARTEDAEDAEGATKREPNLIETSPVLKDAAIGIIFCRCCSPRSSVRSFANER